jgi:hypothetical protein
MDQVRSPHDQGEGGEVEDGQVGAGVEVQHPAEGQAGLPIGGVVSADVCAQ